MQILSSIIFFSPHFQHEIFFLQKPIHSPFPKMWKTPTFVRLVIN